ncbi:hypothetical protein [Hubei tetragnatha maxillosa virus 8]|uniref:hypothetical protein n=1 Tax=Hubei tetragnatha maxillosa virus 8 TaxID=1923250 RepID=UPI00090B3F2F|nr:hypothetical protein [Hubei tetragnatha maxillosa virus 8]APG78159.1 hypothetical protein [Hubei tetragnatha maxillosa virus 8]APG78237.1 hypothetical protein [Hubei tetragnatha maxillosa virus 8]APG78291.1 hypothetical protein [Hubei tetragnatha maxillosa virus 8]
MDMINQLFGDIDITVTKIDVNEDAEYQKYALSLYEKLKLRNGPDVNAIIAELQKEKKERDNNITCLTFTVEKGEDCFDIKDEQVEQTYGVRIHDESIQLLVPKKNHEEDIVSRGTSYLRYIRDSIIELSSDGIEKRTYSTNNIIPEIERIKLPDGWSKCQKQAVRIQAQIIIDERVMRSKLKTFAKFTSEMKFKSDPIGKGVWNITGTKIPTTSPILTADERLRLNSSSMDDLCTITFSNKVGTIARAKMNLSSKVSKKVFDLVIRDSETILAIALAEARVTPFEALSSVFKMNKDNESYTCYACGTAVALKRHTYHSQCKVIQWLLKYYPFEYDQVEQQLSILSAIYISPQTRQRISNILELHNKLNNDIVVRNQDQKVVWSRQEDGSLVRNVYNTDGYVDQVGSHDWRVRVGLSPERVRSRDAPTASSRTTSAREN